MHKFLESLRNGAVVEPQSTASDLLADVECEMTVADIHRRLVGIHKSLDRLMARLGEIEGGHGRTEDAMDAGKNPDSISNRLDAMFDSVFNNIPELMALLSQVATRKVFCDTLNDMGVMRLREKSK